MPSARDRGQSTPSGEDQRRSNFVGGREQPPLEVDEHEERPYVETCELLSPFLVDHEGKPSAGQGWDVP